MTRCRNWEQGFTLVELLVVIAIIALLLSILLPSLTAAREQAKEVRCLANMKDIGTASIGYANSDPTGHLVPWIASTHNDDTVSGARRGFGGKSGLHYLTSEFPEEDNWYGQAYGMWSTKNGFGPTKRPLNKYIYKNVGDRSYAEIEAMPVADAQKDEKLDYSVFKCPSDVGYEEGKDGTTDVIFGYGFPGNPNRQYQLPISTYDAMGTSYACDGLLGGTTARVVSFGVILRKYGQIPNPAQVTTYVENKGFYAAFWNNWAFNDETNFGWGWHGELREHNVTYADGHSSPTKFEVRTNVTGADGYGYVTTGPNWVLRGGTTRNTEWTPSFELSGADLLFGTWAHLLMSGNDWTNHCQPAPPTVVEGLVWQQP